MKRYCKGVDITDVGFIEACIYECLDGKWERVEVHKLLSKYGEQSRGEVCRICSAKSYRHNTGDGYAIDYSLRRTAMAERLGGNIKSLAAEISVNIKNRTLELSHVQHKIIIDGHSGKERDIGRESMIHQIYDYIAVRGAQELFDKKIGVYQCASIPGRGQIYGKRAIEKWLRRLPKTTKYAVKADVKKCYPSIDQERLIELLNRDIKNESLLWLMEILIKQFDSGLSIGSYLSQYLCNYYLSYAYHYAAEQLAITKTRRGQTKRVRLADHVLFYMDDILLLGGNKRQLRQGFEMLRQYMADFLELELKDSWRLFRVQYYDKDGKTHGDVIDMMGYRIGRRCTTVRKRIFRGLRRKVLRVERYMADGEENPLRLARQVSSLYGWLKNSDSYNFICRHKGAFKAANNTISIRAKGADNIC